IQQHIGMTVCVGIAPSKTLAKLANHAAKQYPATRGVVDLTDPIRQKKLLSLMPVHEVWGVGRKLSERLNAMGITTALALAEQNPKDIRQKFSVVLERTVREFLLVQLHTHDGILLKRLLSRGQLHNLVYRLP